MGNNKKKRKSEKKETAETDGLLSGKSNIIQVKKSREKYNADNSKEKISYKNINSDSEKNFKRSKCNKRKLQDNKNVDVITSMNEKNTVENITEDLNIQCVKKMKKNCSSLKKKLKKSKFVDNTTEGSKRVHEELEGSDDDEEIRNELKELSVYKKIQQLVKDNPSLHLGLDSNFSENDLVVDNIKDSSFESDENISDKESIKYSNELPEKLSTKKIPTSSKNQSNAFNQENSISEPIKLCQMKDTLIRDHRDKPKILTFQNKAREKLQAAKFRCLNEKLYTESGKDSFIYFQENADEFLDYHNGYSLQVSKWPLNPVDKIINSLQKLQNNSVIADLGCGDAKIARTFTNHQVYSYDLVALNEYVTPCNISKVPLSNESCDVVIFCLSLMGINLKEYLREAHRIAKLGGILKIAEVESRIENLDQFIKNIESLGFKQMNKDIQHKLFVFLDFKKIKKEVGKAKEIVLKPCLYKKR